MSLPCTVYLPNGNNQSCVVPMSEVKIPIIVTTGMEFADLSEVYNLAEWVEKIQEDLTMHIFQGKMGYEVTTDDPNTITTDESQKIETNRPAPSGMFYLDSQFCDYKDIMKEFKGGTFAVIYLLKDGKFLLHRTTNGTYKGFPARIYGGNKGIPLNADIQNNFPIRINHLDFDDFELGAVIDPAWDRSELGLAMPLGYNMQITTAYAAGDVVVYITERCGDAVTGLALADFNEISSNYLDTPAITAVVDDTGGYYTITLQKGAVPGDLDSGDYIEIRVEELTGTVVDGLSNRLVVTAP